MPRNPRDDRPGLDVAVFAVKVEGFAVGALKGEAETPGGAESAIQDTALPDGSLEPSSPIGHSGKVLFKLTGSSCSGKSTLALSVADRLQQIAVHDFDEVGVPEHPDRHWRHRMTERWVRRALEYQDCGIDLLLTGQSPLGEVLAAPSAPLLDGIAVCLVDVTDEVRRDRLARRDPGRWDAPAVNAFLNWAVWHRGHAHNPHHRPEVIISDSWPGMAWHRWTRWRAEDPRWHTHVLDTTGRPITQSVDQVERWVAEQRAAHRSGRLALARGWTDRTPARTDHDC